MVDIIAKSMMGANVYYEYFVRVGGYTTCKLQI